MCCSASDLLLSVVEGDNVHLEQRTWIKDLKPNDKVLIAGWVHKVVDLGKMCFVVVRDWTGKVQVTAKKGQVSEEVLAVLKNVGKEWVISVSGEVATNPRAPGGLELLPESIEVLNRVSAKLPVDPTGLTPSDFDTRLRYRFLDLRREDVRKLFIAKSIVVNAFRQELLSQGFVEIHPPTIIGAASEGGAEVFPLQYFENKAYLAQSPQLYKQLAVIGGLERVFSTMPVFRAEKHNTSTHLNEVIMLDAELAFVNEQGAMDVLESAFRAMYEALKQKGFTPAFSFEEIPRVTYDACLDVLRDLEWGEDFSREEERRLAKEFGPAFFVYAFPTKARAFYSLPYEEKPELCRAFDLIINGLEVSSGAQRIHRYEELKAAIESRGLKPEDFHFYLEAFKFGAPPHAGFGIGLERMCMQLLGLENIREVALYPRDRTRLCP